MTTLYGYFLEHSRAARIANRKRLLEYAGETELPENFFPIMTPWAWVQDPEMPEQRGVFGWAVSEIPVAAELYLRVEWFHFRPKKTKERQERERKREARRDECRDEKLRQSIYSQTIIGEEPNQDDKGSRIKFLVFCTANIPPEILDRFFTPPNWECLVPENSPLEDITFHVVRSATAPLTSQLFTSSHTSTLSSPFVGLSNEDVSQIFWQLIKPNSEEPSFIATHVFLVLDEVTASASLKDANPTCLLVSDSTGTEEIRRCELGALYYHLPALEMLMMDLNQLAPDPDQVLTVGAIEHEKAEEGRRQA